VQTAEKSLNITNEKGLHVRAATVLAQTANKFRSVVTVEHGGERANGKSVMNLLLLTASRGAKVKVSAVGEDATQAVDAIAQVIERGFYES
jgi:phosphocarrier protein